MSSRAHESATFIILTFGYQDEFLIDFGTNLGPKIDQKSIKNRLKNQSLFWSFFWSIFNRFLIDFGAQVGYKIDNKSMNKNDQHIHIILIDFLINFCLNLKDFRPPRSSKIELSCTRERNFHNFDFWVSRSIFDWFGSQLGLQNWSNID